MSAWVTPTKREVVGLRQRVAHLDRQREIHREQTARIQGLAKALDEAEAGAATVMRIERIRALMDLPRAPRREVAT